MTYNRKSLPTLLLIFVMLFTLTASSTIVGAQDEEPIKVGLVSPFTGAIGFLGVWMGNSVQAEINRINENGGLLGRQVELITRDDEINPARSVEIVREFIDREEVSLIIGPSFSSNALAVRDLIESSGTIAIFPTAGTVELLENNPRYLYRAQESTALTAAELVNFAIENGYASIAILSPDDAFGQDYDALLEELTEDADIEYLGAEFFRDDDQDLTPYALRIKDTGAEVVIVPTGNSSIAARAVVALDSVESEAQILGISGLQGYTFAQLAEDAVLGSIFVATYLGYPAEVAFEDMPARYAEHVQLVIDEYGAVEGASLNTYPGTSLAGLAVWLWEQAVIEAGTLDADAVADALDAMSYTADETPAGVAVSFTPENHEPFGEGSLYFYEWYLKDDGESYGFREVVMGEDE
ncbi:MAG: ABC transporter substrate-binding protein [Aggregatilineales bacterium]